MTDQEQLQWEARLSRPAALAAFAAGLLLLVGTVLLQSIFEDRPRVEPVPDSLLSINESPGALLASAAMQGVAVLCLIAVFYYLFRAIAHRDAQIPRWFVYLVLLGPVMYAVAQVLGAVDRVDMADTFSDQSYRFEDAEPDSSLADCPAIRGQVGEDCAEELAREDPNGATIGLGLAGSVSVAFLFVMVPLRARRVGLLSPFMGILGVIAGVLLIIPLLPLVPVVIQAFWLGAVGALFLGNWPGGRGPAWATGRAEPWPGPAERRGVAPGAEDAPTEDEAITAEPEPAPERPSSRKRKRRKR